MNAISHSTAPPESDPRALLVLDLDETLVHTRSEPLDRAADHRILTYHVYERPGLRDFLEFAFACCRVAVWTGSTEAYAHAVLSRLTDISRFAFVWSREQCSIARAAGSQRFELLKDVAQLELAGYDRSRILFVDDLPHRLLMGEQNVIPVAPFYGAQDDSELTELTPFVRDLLEAGDVRRVQKVGWRRAL